MPWLMQVVAAAGGDWWLRRRLRGWLWLSWSYARRLRAVQALHVEDPGAMAYQQVLNGTCCSGTALFVQVLVMQASAE